jgi:hypothetical protein
VGFFVGACVLCLSLHEEVRASFFFFFFGNKSVLLF